MEPYSSVTRLATGLNLPSVAVLLAASSQVKVPHSASAKRLYSPRSLFSRVYVVSRIFSQKWESFDQETDLLYFLLRNFPAVIEVFPY